MHRIEAAKFAAMASHKPATLDREQDAHIARAAGRPVLTAAELRAEGERIIAEITLGGVLTE